MATVDNTKDLTGFQALSFDCYGTLIDWEKGMAASLAPLVAKLPAHHAYVTQPSLAVKHFTRFSEQLEVSHPELAYDQNFAQSLRSLAAELGVAVSAADEAAIGAAAGTWAPFADTVAGLAVLRRHYKLIILSNIDNANIGRTVREQLRTDFAAVCTAQDIGSYKPAHRNFHYLYEKVREAGVDPDGGELLHAARSLTADHVPAKELGLRSVWISRGGDAEEGYGLGGDYQKLLGEGKLGFEWKFNSIGDFAREVERQFAEKGRGE